MNVAPMQPRRVALIAAACLSTGWLLASIVSPPVAELQVLPDKAQPRSERARPQPEEAPYTEQLHLRMQQLPVAPAPRRNPFVFGSRQRAVDETPRPVMQTAQPETTIVQGPVVMAPSGPSLKLSGIGSTDGPAGPIRTAIISDGTTVHLARIGDTVGGYGVVEIAEDAVALENAAGARWVLRLK